MTTRRASRLILALTAGAATLTLTACGGGSAPAPAAAATARASAAPQAGTQPGVRDQPGGVSGEIVQVGDALLQVRDDEGQTAVSWTAELAVQVTTTTDLSAVTVGSCVSAVTGGGPTQDSTSSDEAADPSGAAASTVTVSEPVDGVCTGGFGGPGGGAGGGPGAPDGMPTDRPTDLPADMPTGMPTDMPQPEGGGVPDAGGPRGFGGFTSGVVTAVDGATLTVETTDQEGATGTATITTDDATVVTTTEQGDVSALVVGRCATVRGAADDGGQVEATSITVSEPGEQGCSTGLAGGRFPGARGGTDGTGGTAEREAGDA